MNILFIVIVFVSGIVAGMGIGGGSIFILLTTIFNLLSDNEAKAYNLIMFIVVGISATITNLKNNNIDKSLFKKFLIPVCLGSGIGILIAKKIDENFLKNLFYGFMLLLGVYEIISSLKTIITAKNNNSSKWKEWFYEFC